ncbi:MAG: TolC family protein, partial [Sulfurimonas sp.]|nr:TolC family protein [Sulfurimonas sp.]
MLKKTLITLSLPLILSAYSMPDLFDALKNHSQTKSDAMAVKKAKVYEELANSKLYPKINLFAKYDYYTIASAMVPLPPNDMMALVKDPTKPSQPFSQNTTREGVSFSMPLFMKSIFTMADKAEAMQKSAKAKKHINLLKNEAIIVGSNANFIYLEGLQESLATKEKSLLETKKTLQIKV